MTTSQYLDKLNSRFKAGNSTEHTFRGDLEILIKSLYENIDVTNEPKHEACGAPDYIITRKNIPVGYIEAKDIDADIESKNYKKQFDRYKNSLENLIFTNYLDFHFYKSGQFVTSVSIGEISRKNVVAFPDKFNEFENLMKDFCSYTGQTIKSAQKLSEMMAGKARMLANVIENALTSDEKTDENSTLLEQMNAFKEILIHDIKPKEFSDIYSQTIAYGMFAARLHDPSLNNFSRIEAQELIPKSNPFLRKLFGYIAGPDIDGRIRWIVDALADIFRATNVKELLKDFGKATAKNDPMIHFYETFLAEYDPKLRKARGVWYTPEPVVNFIVRAVDDILKTEFNLPEGLADKSKIKLKINEQDKQAEKEFHKVQILDPATGTGTFLAEVIKQIYKKFEGQQGVWSNYVEEHLIPRLNGFELLMASYAMAHLKMELLLSQTGYKPKDERTQQRLRIYLTNSLEESFPSEETGLASWLNHEALEADKIKRDTPVMVVIGNPPYSVSSSNASVNSLGEKTWIGNLIDDYKKDLNEKKINIDDDYIKFIRYGEHFIEKNKSGILAYISNNSFIDGITHRQMRKHLLETFDKIYILDLHGNARRKETNLDGTTDQNVFDIMQGVSINLFIKTNEKEKEELAEVKHFDLYGLRKEKYKTLFEKSLKKIKWSILEYKEPYYFFVPKNFSDEKKYENGFLLSKLFHNYNSGVETAKDELVINSSKDNLQKIIDNFKIFEPSKLSNLYQQNIEKINQVQKDLNRNNYSIIKISYRPFDIRNIIYTEISQGVLWRPRHDVMKHFLNKNNIGLIFKRGFEEGKSNPVFISDKIIDRRSWTRSGMQGAESFAPLYTYPDSISEDNLFNQAERMPNLNPDIVKQIAEKLSLKFTNEKENKKNTFAPIDILDYIYAVLHSPSYREKYKEFLKIDFPRVPYPKDEKSFWHLVKLGGELREIHLLESPAVKKFITKFPIDGNNEVGKIRYEDSKVWINEIQYFDNVPAIAWEFYIGGYQPAQKWLKDRKERTLNFDDIEHYQKIIVALCETDRLMKEIDEIGVE